MATIPQEVNKTARVDTDKQDVSLPSFMMQDSSPKPALSYKSLVPAYPSCPWGHRVLIPKTK